MNDYLGSLYFYNAGAFMGLTTRTPFSVDITYKNGTMGTTEPGGAYYDDATDRVIYTYNDEKMKCMSVIKTMTFTKTG